MFVLTEKAHYFSSAPPKPPESGKKSRWDVSEQKVEKKKEDPLGELLSAARNQTETRVEHTPTPALPALPASISSSDQAPGSKPEVVKEQSVQTSRRGSP